MMFTRLIFTMSNEIKGNDFVLYLKIGVQLYPVACSSNVSVTTTADKIELAKQAGSVNKIQVTAKGQSFTLERQGEAWGMTETSPIASVAVVRSGLADRSEDELAEWVAPTQQLADQADEVYALFNNNRDDFAPRSAVIFRGLLDEAGIAATGGLDLPPAEMTLF